jgi:hypothetical protein
VSADLSGANVTDCLCLVTLFTAVDLSEVKGLETISHHGPSTVGVDTLFKSKGKIPEAFLHGCGVPDGWITNIPALVGTMQPIQFYSCFISYSHMDEEFAERLHDGLRGKGVRCWYAPHDLPIGARIRPVIDDSIQVYDKLLLALSEHSVGSQWVEQEVETALRRERDEPDKTVLFPVRLDDAVFAIKKGWPSLIYNTRHIGDMRGWRDHEGFKKEFERLLQDLKAGGPPAK